MPGMSRGVKGLYAIVELPHRHGLPAEVVTEAVLGHRPEGGREGASAVQLRAEGASTEQRIDWLRRMLPPCRRAGVPLHVHDDIEAAIDARADGVHLDRDDPGGVDPSAIRQAAAARDHGLCVGLATHDLAQLRQAGRRSPDYLTLGPVAPIRSGTNGEPVLGWAGLLDGCRMASRPLVASGGLDLQSAPQAAQAGASAVAVLEALVFDDPERIRTQAHALSRALAAAATPLELDEVHRRIPVLAPEQLAELARWGDSLGVHIGLGLPARFSPWIEDGRPLYRPCDVLDLVMALGKRPQESWDEWRRRDPDDAGPLVQLRRP